MAIELRDTVSLMQAMERITPPASFLLDTFFPLVPATAVTTKIAVEYRKRGRQLTPFPVTPPETVSWPPLSFVAQKERA